MIKISEMAYNRSDALTRCADLGEQFIEHFIKVMDAGGKDDPDLIYHCDVEMFSWLDKVRKIVLKPKGKKLNAEQLIDWFFTTGSSMAILLPEDYVDIYSNFIVKLLADDNKKVSTALLEAIDSNKDINIEISEAKEQARGVFWVIDDKLYTFPFYDDNIGVAKSGVTYNHKKLWNELKEKSSVPYNYHPRGRVDFDNKGRPIIYMNPNIEQKFISDIQSEFGLRTQPKIFYDNSEHYKCYLDDGWKPDNSK